MHGWKGDAMGINDKFAGRGVVEHYERNPGETICLQKIPFAYIEL